MLTLEKTATGAQKERAPKITKNRWSKAVVGSNRLPSSIVIDTASHVPEGSSVIGTTLLSRTVIGTANGSNYERGGKMLALQTIEPAGVNAVDAKGDWEELKMVVDSGATEAVMSEDMLTSTETEIGAAAKRGVEYEVANGVTIPNLGEKTFKFQTAEGAERKITAQICEVNKGLLSVVKMVNAGNTVVFSKSGSFIEDDNSGERININEENGMYVLSMWVKRSPF